MPRRNLSRSAQEESLEIPQLLTIHQVAERLAISPAKAYSLVWSGRLPAIRIDRSVRVSAAVLKLWIEQMSI
jgi:excisionase family DNA binding protein